MGFGKNNKYKAGSQQSKFCLTIYIQFINCFNMLNLLHKNLDVYKVALLLMKEVYHITKNFPVEERYGLISQLRRASVSVCSNVAEGSARISAREKKRFYEISRASLVEIDAQMDISIMLGYTSKEKIAEFEKYEESVFKMLSKLITKFSVINAKT